MPRFDYHQDRPGWFPAAEEFGDAMVQGSSYPQSYIYGTFLTLSGHLLGRRIYTVYATPLYPNFYTCLVGASGISHKSTCMKLGLQSLGELKPFVMRNITTTQGLLKSMTDNNSEALVVLDEFASLITKKRQDFAADLMARLVELYDCPDVAGTYTRIDPLTVKNPWLSILAGSTIEWLRANLTVSDLMAGVGNRLTFILGDPRPENPWPVSINWKNYESWHRLDRVEGRINLDGDAMDVWETFYKRFMVTQKKATPFLRMLAERIPEKIIKTAMIECAWEHTYTIDYQTLEHAIDWGSYLYQCLTKLAPAFEDVDKQVLASMREGYISRQLLFGALAHQIPVKRLRESISNLTWLGFITESSGYFSLVEEK